MVPPCINKFYILDLQPENSLVRYAVEQGNTVFLILAQSGHEHAAPDVGRLRGARRDRSHPCHAGHFRPGQAQLFGFCVGGTIVSTALAVLKARGENPAASLTLLTTFLDFCDTALDVFIDEPQVALREQTLAKGGLMPGRDLGSTFSSLRPNDLVWNYVQSNYLKGNEPPAFDLLYWNGDSTGLPGPMFCWYLRNTYLENSLKTGKLTRRAGRPGSIDAPAFIYGSREDHIVPCAAYASMAVLNPKKPKANRFVLGASGHIAGVINRRSKNKRSYWINDAGKGARAAKPSLTAEQWMEGATERGQLVAGMGGLPGRTRRRRREGARQAGQQTPCAHRGGAGPVC
jgi:polyhydroxyalkanoate synthase